MVKQFRFELMLTKCYPVLMKHVLFDSPNNAGLELNGGCKSHDLLRILREWPWCLFSKLCAIPNVTQLTINQLIQIVCLAMMTFKMYKCALKVALAVMPTYFQSWHGYLHYYGNNSTQFKDELIWQIQIPVWEFTRKKTILRQITVPSWFWSRKYKQLEILC